MKKTFLAKRNSALLSSADFSWGAYAVLFAVLILLMRITAPNFFWRVFTPVLKSADAISAANHTFFSSFGSVAELAAQNEKLQSENAALARENETLLQKAAGLSALLGVPVGGKNSQPGILADVVARPPESPYDTLVVAAGSREGILTGMEAFGTDGTPVGVVSSVLTDFSRVTLLSSPGMSTAGWVGHSAIPLTITGTGAGSMSASLSRSTGVTVGDTVFAPGPGMRPIGKVMRIDSDSSSPAMTLRIMPAVNPFSIGWIVVRDTGTALLNQLASPPTLP